MMICVGRMQKRDFSPLKKKSLSFCDANLYSQKARVMSIARLAIANAAHKDLALRLVIHIFHCVCGLAIDDGFNTKCVNQ